MTKNPFLYLNFIVNKLPNIDHKKVRRIKLSHEIYSGNYNSRICFIISNQLMEKNEELLENISPWKFLTYDYVKKNYTEYKDKRSFLREFDLFFCERKITPLMKK